MKNLPNLFPINLQSQNKMGDFQTFVTFLEYMNCIILNLR